MKRPLDSIVPLVTACFATLHSLMLNSLTLCVGLVLFSGAGEAAGADGGSATSGSGSAKRAAAGKVRTVAKDNAAKDNAKDKTDSDDEEADDDKPAFRLEPIKEIVLWNEHNGKHHDSGTQTCNLALSLDGKTVWHRENVEVPWEANKSTNRVITVANVKADTLRVEITAWNEKSGGLSEVEVLDKTGTNLATGGKVTTSASRSSDDPLGGAALIDGDFYSASNESGYWLLPEGKTGWAEIELVPQKIPPPPAARAAKKKGKKTLSQVPMPAELFVACDSAFDIYINGQRALTGHGQRCFDRTLKIANGDVITVKCDGSSDTKGGLCLLIKFEGKKFFLSTANEKAWQVYAPSDPANWYAPERAKGTGPAVKGTSSWVEKEMKEETHGKIPQIWGAPGKTCYLVMVADTTVVHPKMKPGQRR
jgi:hypothetical protein